MRGLAAVALREINEKRFVFVAAGISSLLPFLAHLMPGLDGYPAADARDASAFFFAIGFAVVLSLILGATTIVRDLVDHRMSFFFSRPLGGVSIAVGKILGAVMLTLVSSFGILLPATLAGGGLHRLGRTEIPILEFNGFSFFKVTAAPAASILVVCLIVVFLTVLAHAVSLILRSRSVWIALDVLGLSVTLALMLVTSRNLSLLTSFHEKSRWLFLLSTVVFLLGLPALILATVLQVSKGRIDLRRGHRILSIALWSCLSLFTGTVAALSAWYVTPKPADIAAFASIVPAPDGDWIAFAGIARHRPFYLPTFLYNVRTGAFRRTRAAVPWTLGDASIEFSRDGSRAAWLEVSAEDKPSYDVVVVRLGNDFKEEGVLTFHDWPRFFLSSDGSRMGIVAGGVLSVMELASMHSSLSIRIPDACDDLRDVFFISNDRIRMVARRTSSGPLGLERVFTIFEVDITSKKLYQTGEVQVVGDPLLERSPSGDRFLLQDRKVESLTLCDGRTGAIIAVLTMPRCSRVSPRFLADDGILVVETSDGIGRIETFSPDGDFNHTVDLGHLNSFFVGGQVSSDRILVALGSGDSETWTPLQWNLVSVGLAHGDVRELGSGLFFPLSFGGSLEESRPGSLGTQLLLEANQQLLLRLDPLTGQRRVILGSKR